MLRWFRFCGFGFGQARGAAAPVDDLGLIDVEAAGIACVEAWPLADGTVDIFDACADSADDVMVVVASAGLVPSRRPHRLDAAQQPEVAERVQSVVHGLARDRADLVAHPLQHLFGDGVRLRAHHAKHGKALRRHIDALLAENVRRVCMHCWNASKK